MTDIRQLPDEVIAQIFAHLNGVAFSRVHGVCRRWRRISRMQEAHGHPWVRICLSEVPAPSLVQLTGFVDLARLADRRISASLARRCRRLPWCFWRDVYVANYRCRHVGAWPQRCKKLEAGSARGRVTCVKFQDNMLISGHEDGSVLCWKNIGTEYQQFKVQHRHLRRVTSVAIIQLMIGQYTVTYVWTYTTKPSSSNLHQLSQQGNQTDKVFVSDGGFVVFSGSADHCLKAIIHGTPVTWKMDNSTEINTISSWGNQLVIGGMESIVQGQSVWEVSSTSRDVRQIGELHGHLSSQVSTVTMWNDTVVAGDTHGHVYMWVLGPDGVGNNRHPSVVCYDSPVKQLLHLGDRILIGLLGSGCLIVDWRDKGPPQKLDVFESIQRDPECIAARGPLFALGVKSGLVFVYHMENEAKWLSIDLQKYSDKIHTGDKHILAMDFADSGKGPVLAIATESSSIHLVHWMPK